MKTYLVALIACLSFFSGCKTPSRKPGCPKEQTTAPARQAKKQQLKINILEDPQTIDPRKARTLRDINLAKFFMEGLTRVSKSGKAELALATNYEVSKDLKTYTFHLRPSQWSNGDPITAQDFVYTYKKTLSPSFPTDYGFALYVLKNGKSIKGGLLPTSLLGVSATDERTLVLELESPIPYLLELLATPVFFPVNSKVDRKNSYWAESADTYVSSGPFLMKSWKHKDKLVAEKNPLYWDSKEVNIDRIDMVMVSEETGFNLYANNELDWEGSPFSQIPVDARKTLQEKKKLHSSPLLATYWIRLNTEKVPFNSVYIRRALAHAINREALVQHVAQGNQIPSTGIVPAFMDVQEGPYFKDGDLDAATDLFERGLQELGRSKASLPEITLMYYTGELNHRVAQAIQQQWYIAFGIKVLLQPLESKVYFSNISKQNYMLATGFWYADYNDPISFLEVFKTKNTGTNNTHWENAEYKSLIETSYHAKDVEERKLVLRKSEKILIDEMPVIPIFSHTTHHIQNPALKGVVLSKLGNVDFKWAYIDESEK